MRTSESITKICAALVKAQSSFPPIVRTKKAEIKGDKANYSFMYAPLEEILHTIRPTLLGNGLTIMQGVEGFNLVTTLFHDSGEFISHSMEMPHSYPTARAFGSELSYRRRYLVSAILNLASEEDDDGQAAEQATRTKPRAKESSSISGAAFCRECYESMDAKEQEFLRNIAANAVALLDEGRTSDAYGYIEKQRLDDKEKPALWSLLDSKQRSAIKKAGEQFSIEQKALTTNKEAA